MAMGYLPYIAKTLRPHRGRLVLSILFWLGIMAVDLGSPLVVAVLIDVVVGQGRYELLGPLILAFAALPFMGAVMHFSCNYLGMVVSQRIVLEIRLDLYRRVHNLSCRFLQGTTTGKLMERLRGDVQQIQTVLASQLPAIVVQVITGLFMLVVMFVISVKLTLLVVAAIALYVVNYKYFVRRIRAVQRRYRRKMDALSGMAQERLTGNMIVKSYGAERREARRFVRRNFLAERTLHRFRMLNVCYGVTSSMNTWTTYLVVMLLGAYFAVQGELTYGAVTAMAAFTMRLLAPALALAELSNQIQQAKVSLDRIFELMDSEPDVTDRGGLRLAELRGEVTFRNVCFQYEPNKPVLRHMNFCIQPGQTVALVGHTGCGKTTIASLIYRYYEAQSGGVLIDGHDIVTLDPRWYRHRLAMVPQDPVVFDTTLAENISYGRPDATLQDIERVARMAELGGLIDSLPKGLHSSLYDGGVKLSVGEKQRLCIARAMLAEPTILILDEATSSLDPQSEALIQLALKRVMANRTCFVIAHRLSTVVEADLIIVLDQGQVLEMGNHGQLMSKGGHYHHLVMTQSRLRQVVESA
jgi:subfamily B ATP-binding cassette protein MsbA